MIPRRSRPRSPETREGEEAGSGAGSARAGAKASGGRPRRGQDEGLRRRLGSAAGADVEVAEGGSRFRKATARWEDHVRRIDRRARRGNRRPRRSRSRPMNPFLRVARSRWPPWLGVYPAGMTEAQWATAAGYKRTGGTWGTYKSRLRGAGLMEQREGKFFATEAGAKAVGDVELPPKPGPDLARWWAAKLPGTSRLAEALIECWPEGLTKEDLATRIDMVASGGSFGTYLSRLASAGVITRDGKIRLAAEIMGE
jgi:hypothetical protein